MDILLEKLKTKKYVLGLVTLVIILIAVPITVLQISRQQELRQHAAAPAVSFSFSPQTATITKSGAFPPVQVFLNTNGNNVTALDIRISYDQSLLLLKNFTPESTFTTITNDSTSATGTVHYVGVNPSSTAITGNSILLGTLTFAMKDYGTAQVSFSDIQVTAQGQSALLPIDTANTHPGSYSLVGDGTLTPSPSACPLTPIDCAAPPVNCNYTGGSCSSCGTLVCTSPTVVPTGPASGNTMMYLALSLPGIGSNYTQENATPSATTRAFTYTIESPGDNTPQSGTLTYNAQTGAYDASIPVAVPVGTYTVKVKLPNTLAKLIPGVQVQSTSACPTGANCVASIPAISSSGTSLISGDVVSDNIIDVNDYNALLKCYQQTTCTIQEQQAADLNDDGVVDAKDLNILLRAFYTRNGD